ncbi:MAG TPA: SdrD B-like domain-containing protein, partial [Roseiflexaceae bacterium]|nr:SdrD B-like domain-containing protein [Roseiflexaceae bacterium]
MSLDLLTLGAGATVRVRVMGTARTALAREDFVNTATITTTTPQTRTDNDQSSVPGAVWTTDVQVVKLSAPQVVAGSTFTATLLVRNNGPAVAQSVLLADTLPDGVTLVSATTDPTTVQGARLEWQLGDLASGAGVEIGLILDAAADLVDSSQLVNTAQVATLAPDRDTGNDRAAATTLVVTQADLELAKRGPEVAYAGETIEYELTYRNNGPSWARDVVVTDALPPELAFAGAVPPANQQNGALVMWNVGDLAPGQAGTLRVSAASAPEQTEPSRTVNNQARVSSATPDREPANDQDEQQTALQTVDVRIAKEMPPFVVAGAEFTATLQIENAGPLLARSIAVRDFLPGGLTLVRSNPPTTAAGPRWSLAALAAGETRRLELVLRAPSSALSGTLYLNTATIDTGDPDREGGNNAASDTTIVRPNADLVVVKTGTPGPVRTGTPITYTLKYRNDGPSLASGVTLTDELPEGVVLHSSVPAPSAAAGQRLVWQLGDLAVGASGSVTIQASVYGALNETQTTRHNQAEIAADTPDPAPENNRSWHDLVVQQPDLAVFKDDDRSVVLAGDTLTYTIRVRNNGPVAASGVALREEPPSGSRVLSNEWVAQSDGSFIHAVGDLAPGAVLTFQFALRLPHPFAAATARNRVGVTHDDPDPTPEDNVDDDVDDVEAMRIGDRAWLDDNGDGTQDTGEIGLAGVLIHVLDPVSHAVVADATTDAQGMYLVTGLRPGVYDIQLAPETTQLGAYRGYR